YIWWGGDPDVANPVSGLTRREIHAVQKSWAPVNANAVANGTELLRRLFKTFPDSKEFFSMVRKLPEEQYMESPQFKAHVMNLMSALNLAVTSLHQPREDLKEVIVTMFIEVLQLDAQTLGAWGKTVDFWYKNIFETLNEGETR
ncbi:Globin, partial [Operophtera brumata]